jgi:hypothetical protein
MQSRVHHAGVMADGVAAAVPPRIEGLAVNVTPEMGAPYGENPC